MVYRENMRKDSHLVVVLDQISSSSVAKRRFCPALNFICLLRIAAEYHLFFTSFSLIVFIQEYSALQYVNINSSYRCIILVMRTFSLAFL